MKTTMNATMNTTMDTTSELRGIRRKNITTRQRVKYLLEKYSVKLQPATHGAIDFPEANKNHYFNEDQNFLSFYASV